MKRSKPKESYTNMKPGFFASVKRSLDLFGFWKSFYLFLMLKVEEREFISSAKTKEEKKTKKLLLSKLKNAYSKVMCLHFPFQFVLIADFLLQSKNDGPIIECGAYRGGSSAQLSIIAKMTNRKLIVCDSFEGLPEPESRKDATLNVFHDERVHNFEKGDYSASLEEVKHNIAEHGCIDVCEFIPGFFNKSLPKLKEIKPSAVIIDVDLISSARDCLKYLWPQLQKNGYVFTHEAEYENYMRAIMDPDWWSENLKQAPPIVFGAGSSLSPLAEGLAMITKYYD